MSDTPQDSNHSFPDWSGFRGLFRTFRLAVQSGKMLLAVAGLVLTYLVGLSMDAIWSAGGATVYSGEVLAYVSQPVFSTWKQECRHADDRMLASMLVEYKVADDVDEARNMLGEDRAEALSELRREIDERLGPQMDLQERRKLEEDRIEKRPENQRKAAREELEEQLPSLVARSRAEYLALKEEIKNLGNQGVFSEWITHELHFAQSGLKALLRGRIASDPYAGTERSGSPYNPFAPTSFLGALACAVGGSCWMVREHTWYASIFMLLNLAIWSLFGGGICRMAALHATRDKKISIREALSFAAGKWKDFFLAPIIPMIFILLVGLMLLLGGMATAIPIVGEIVGPLIFPLALLGGFVIALVTVGVFGGIALMWPTIGVEASDSFDAISRSFSYIYNRPWRAIFFGLVLLVYGGLCYVFLRFFLWLMLMSVHVFVSMGTGLWTERPEAGVEMNKFDVMWQMPAFSNLRPQFEWVDLSRAEPFGAAVIWVFVTLLVLALHAFVISFELSGVTWIYLLLRREVDATDVEDVYDEDYDQPEPAPAPTTDADAGTGGKPLPVVESPAPASPKPAEQPGPEQQEERKDDLSGP